MNMVIYHIDMVILDIDVEYGLMIWEMTVSIWSSSVSIWDILSLCLVEVHARALGVDAQVESESKVRQRFVILQLQALKPVAVNPGSLHRLGSSPRGVREMVYAAMPCAPSS